MKILCVLPILIASLFAVTAGTIIVGKHLPLSFTTLSDRRDQPDSEPLGQHSVDANAKYLSEKASPESFELANHLSTIIKTVDSAARINRNESFVGVRVGNKPFNVVMFVPTKQFVSVNARIPDAKAWSGKLEKGGFKVIGWTSGSCVNFLVTKETATKQKALLLELFSAAMKLG